MQPNGTWTTHEESLSDHSFENKSIQKSPKDDTTTFRSIEQNNNYQELRAETQPTSATTTKVRSLPFDVSINNPNNNRSSTLPSADAWMEKSRMGGICSPRYRSSPIDDFISASSDSWDDESVIGDSNFFDTTRERSLIDAESRDDTEDIDDSEDIGDHEDDDNETYRDPPIDMMRSRSIDFHRSVSESFIEEEHTFKSMPKLAQGPNSHLRGSSTGYENTEKSTTPSKWVNMNGLAGSTPSSSVSSFNHYNTKRSTLTEAQFLQSAEEHEKQKKKQQQAGNQQQSKDDNSILSSMLISLLSPFQCGAYHQE